MKKAIETIRGQDVAELKAQLNDLRKEQWKLEFRGAPEEVNKTTRHREVRRTIARILTILGQRDRAAAGTGAAKVAKPVPAAKVPAPKAPVKSVVKAAPAAAKAGATKKTKAEKS
jgi:large subunit ribosomal protein L29